MASINYITNIIYSANNTLICDLDWSVSVFILPIRFEFDCAFNSRVLDRIVPVVMEPRMLNQREWTGPLGARLRGRAHCDLTSDDPYRFDRGVRELVLKIRSILSPPTAAVQAQPSGQSAVLRRSLAQDNWRYSVQKGHCLDALDIDNKWWEAKVVEVKGKVRKIKISGMLL